MATPAGLWIAVSFLIHSLYLLLPVVKVCFLCLEWIHDMFLALSHHLLNVEERVEVMSLNLLPLPGWTLEVGQGCWPPLSTSAGTEPDAEGHWSAGRP